MKILKNKYKAIEKLYLSGKKLKEIAIKYKVTIQCIAYVLKKLKITTRTNKDYRDYHLNENFFDIIDTYEKAIIFGFICADGHNNVKKNQIAICIHRKDINYLYEINKRIQPDKKNPIVFESRKAYEENDERGKMARLTIYCSHICKILDKLGCCPKKSLVLSFPTIKKEFISSFVLGYFDGDGGISFRCKKTNSKRDYSVSISLSDPSSLQMKKIIKSFVDINCHLRKHGKISEICISGNNNVLKFLDWIYSISPIRLERKYKQYQEMKRYFSEYVKIKKPAEILLSTGGVVMKQNRTSKKS